MSILIPVLMVFLGCCSNVVFLELLIRDSPSCGTTATFSQFFILALDGFVRTSKFASVKRNIPLSAYLLMVASFFLTSLINNLVFNFHISMPLHLIFRSGSLMANLTLGVLLLGKSYRTSKYISVLMISIGLCMATLASVQDGGSSGVGSGGGSDVDGGDSGGGSDVDGGDRGGDGSGGVDDDVALLKKSESFLYWLLGIVLLTVALFMSALMGLYQEKVYSTYGKHHTEAIFYNHALPLPFFIFFYRDLLNHIHIFNQSEALLPGILPIPKLWAYIIGNMITQYICIKAVFILTTECASLTVTLVVTLRKFVSLTFSIVYFANPFTSQHWAGSLMVFGGTLMFSGVFDAYLDALGKVVVWVGRGLGLRSGAGKSGVDEKKVEDLDGGSVDGGEVVKDGGVVDGVVKGEKEVECVIKDESNTVIKRALNTNTNTNTSS